MHFILKVNCRDLGSTQLDTMKKKSTIDTSRKAGLQYKIVSCAKVDVARYTANCSLLLFFNGK